MVIKSLTQELLPALYKYNKEIYPDKVIPADEYVQFWMSKAPEDYIQSLAIVDENDNIHGQILTSGMSVFYKGQNLDTLWLFDLIVDENLRKDAWGMDIIVECFQKHPCLCSTGCKHLD